MASVGGSWADGDGDGKVVKRYGEEDGNGRAVDGVDIEEEEEEDDADGDPTCTGN